MKMRKICSSLRKRSFPFLFNHYPYVVTYFESDCEFVLRSRTMARGQQKIQSQQKQKAKLDKLKKAQGPDQKKAAQAALVHKCSVCMSQMPDPKTYRQHFESKHPKAELPDILKAN
ncbi:hypothetical protein ScPMuIL_008109 [Solemya velum]